MNKTVNINLAGIFFHIDEDAYLKLSRYLEAIKRSFTDSQGREEIISDIEARISELFTERMKTERQVIGNKEVEEVILDAEGLLANSFPRDLIVDFSTVLPETSDNLFNACKSKEVSFVDSPIGRLAKNAWDGSSMFMIGAKEEDLSRIKPFLEAMGTTLSSLWGTRSWYKN